MLLTCVLCVSSFPLEKSGLSLSPQQKIAKRLVCECTGRMFTRGTGLKLNAEIDPLLRRGIGVPSHARKELHQVEAVI